MFVPNSDDTLASFLAPVSGECVITIKLL